MNINQVSKNHYLSKIVTKDGHQSPNNDREQDTQIRRSMVLVAARRRQNCDIFLPRELRSTKNTKQASDERRRVWILSRAGCNTISYVDRVVFYVRYFDIHLDIKNISLISPWNQRTMGCTFTSQDEMRTWNGSNIESVYQGLCLGWLCV